MESNKEQLKSAREQIKRVKRQLKVEKILIKFGSDTQSIPPLTLSLAQAVWKLRGKPDGNPMFRLNEDLRQSVNFLTVYGLSKDTANEIIDFWSDDTKQLQNETEYLDIKHCEEMLMAVERVLNGGIHTQK